MFKTFHDVPFLIPQECDAAAVECLDASGRPLLVTPKPQRTGLVRVLAGVVCRAPGRRIHTRRVVPVEIVPQTVSQAQPQALIIEPSVETPGWTLSAVGPVLAAEAREGAVWRQLLAEPYWQKQLAPLTLPDLLPLRILEPEEAEMFFPAVLFGLTRLYLYQMRIPVKPHSHDDHLWLDPHEVRGLAEQFPNLFSPLLTYVLTLFSQK